jgi:uncharacterized protein
MYFIKACESRNEWWRYLITILSVVFVQFLGSVPFLVILAFKQSEGNFDIQAFRETLNFETIGLSQTIGLIIILLPSVLCFFSLIWMIILLHKRTLGNIASYEGKIRWKRIWLGSLVWLFLLILCELTAALIHPGNYEFHFNLIEFLPLLFISLLLIPFQAGFEELLFRSYLMQGAGLLFRFRILALLITAVGFGLLHGLNPEVKEYGFLMTMSYYIGFGLFAGLLVIMDNGIELAIGVHAINNIYGAVLVTYKGSALQTPAIWVLNKIDTVYLNISFVVMVVLFLLFCSRKYAWSDWGKILRRIG